MLLDQMLTQHRTVTPGLGHTLPSPNPLHLHLHLKAAIAVKNGVVGCLIRDGAIPEMWGSREGRLVEGMHAARSR